MNRLYEWINFMNELFFLRVQWAYIYIYTFCKRIMRFFGSYFDGFGSSVPQKSQPSPLREKGGGMAARSAFPGHQRTGWQTLTTAHCKNNIYDLQKPNLLSWSWRLGKKFISICINSLRLIIINFYFVKIYTLKMFLIRRKVGIPEDY